MLNQKDMKYLIEQTNELLKRNFNMISFNSLPEEELLKLLGEILKAMSSNLMGEVVDSRNLEVMTTDLFNALQKVKYEPTVGVTEFREGLFQGKQSIVHPIILWILENQAEIKKRAYLSKYVDEIPIPAELSNEPDVDQAIEHEHEVSVKFWQVFKEHARAQKVASVSEEIHVDLGKMKSEISNLEQRIKIQSGKMPTQKNDAAIATITKFKHMETQMKPFTIEMDEIRNTTATLAADCSNIRKHLEMTTFQESGDFNPMQQASEQSRVNDILIQESLQVDMKKLAVETQALCHYTLETIPTNEDFDMLQMQENEVSQEITKLQRKKANLFGGSNRELDAYRNQVEMFSTRRQNVSAAIITLRENVEKLEHGNAAKMASYQKLVGGSDGGGDGFQTGSEILQGDMLKQFIGKLRERSVVYKRLRELLAGLYGELGISVRTMEILRLAEPRVEEKILHMDADPTAEQVDSNNAAKGADGLLNTMQEYKKECLSMYGSWKQQRLTIEEYVRQLGQVRMELGALDEEMSNSKMMFLDEVKSYPDDVQDLGMNIEKLDSDVKRFEGEWRDLQAQMESVKAKIANYQDQLIQTGDGDNLSTAHTLVKQRDTMTKEIHDISAQLNVCLRMKLDAEGQIHSIQKTRQMILMKLEKHDD